MKKADRRRQKKGFTLAEVLTTVLILVILMAVAIPAIFTIRKNIRQKALDHKAELIYTAVQNNLTKLRSNGSSERYAADKADRLTATPADADGGKVLYYVTSDKKENTGNAASVLMTEDTVDADLYQHYWVVEYDPASASVYAVFYSETRSDYTTDSYNPLRYKDRRLKDGARVGYYGGDSIDSSNTSTLAPKITVKNEEKLEIAVTSKRPDSNPLSYIVTLEDTKGHKLTLNYRPNAARTGFVHGQDDLHLAESSTLDGNESGTIVGTRYALTITLDDLTDADSRFSALYQTNKMLKDMPDRQLTPGTPLTVTVQVKSESSLVDGLSATVTTNSLFGDESSETQAAIIYGRHLQNLDEASGVTEEVTEAVQRSDIHFEKQNDAQEDGEDTASWYSCYGEKTFQPITNPYLKNYQGSYAQTETGAQSAAPLISHLTTEPEMEAGLFAHLPADMKVSDLRISGSTITGTGETGSCAGVIAAAAEDGVTLENCQIYLDTEDVEGKTEDQPWISEAEITGGLIGEAKGNVKITGCLAATVQGTEDTVLAGGMIGQAEGTVYIAGSYTDSYITGKITGGMIARAESTVQIEGCYTAGYQKAVDIAGGFLADAATAATINNSYTAVTWLSAADGSDTTVRYATVPKLQESEEKDHHVFFLNGGTDYSMKEEENQAVGEKVDYAILSNRSKMLEKLASDVFVSNASVTFPYNLRNQGLSGYSYPALAGMPHYGDWEANFEAGSLVYYEIYSDGSCGFFGGNLSSTLQDNKTVTGDGYGVVYAKDAVPSGSFRVSYQSGTDENGDMQTEQISIDPLKSVNYSVEVKSTEYLVYPLPSEVINGAALKDTYYQKVTIQGAFAEGDGSTDSTDNATGNVFFFNPHFAKSAVSSADGAKAPETPKDIRIRTARQLYHVSLYYKDYVSITEKSVFNQELDIDYGTYNWTEYAGTDKAVTLQTPIGEGTGFTAVYDGKHHSIQGISFQSGQTAVGFVSENKGTLQNIFLVSDYQTNGTNPYLNYTGQIGNNRTVYMGTLAGINSGRIQNCAGSGFCLGEDHTIYVRQNGTLYAGGLTGSNRGTMLNCETDIPLMNTNILYGKAFIGGFAGENTSSGRIRNSYAIGKASVEYAKGAKAVLAGFTAKNTGVLTGDYCAVAMTAAGSTDTYGFAPKGGNISGTCYYLSGGTFRYLGNMEAFDNTAGSGKALTYDQMKEKGNQPASYCHSATQTDAAYPFAAVVTNAAAKPVHFGNWQLPSDLGSVGVLYWELEENGANNGYHFSYIGYTANAQNPYDTLNRVSGNTLCQQHDDGGIVTEYGYAYYYAVSKNAADVSLSTEESGFQKGKENTKASKALTERLNGFKVVAYTTAPAIATEKKDTGNYMKMTSTDANGVWKISYNHVDYSFTINPFFGNAMQYGTESGEAVTQELNVLEADGRASSTSLSMPGTADNQYQIRSAAQLQYLNWNSNTGDAVTTLNASNYSKVVNTYPYLGWMTPDASGAEGNYYLWLGNESPYPQEQSNYGSYWKFVESSDGKSYSFYEKKSYGTGYYWDWVTKNGYWKWTDANPWAYNYYGQYYDSGYWKEVSASDGKFYWIQSHDVDAAMKPQAQKVFTQIGSLYDTKMADFTEEANAYISYFTGNYDGNTYSIKNVEINSTNTVVGLFGNIIGAQVKNIILYSENGNYIQRSANSPRSWYAMGGMCGLAAVGKGYSASETTIVNCTVSGYQIKDNSTQGSYGDGNVGGMFGMSTLDLKQCTAVNTIILNTVFDNGKRDGVSVRTGGLVGSMRGNITKCYTGGEITCTSECLANAVKRSPDGSTTCAKIYLGGITGGIYIKNKGTMMKLLGDNIQGISSSWKNDSNNYSQNLSCKSPTTVLTDCYTYMKMPDAEAVKALKSVEPLGSNGETPNENERNYHTGIKITNCYYYRENIPDTSIKHFTTGDAGAGGGLTNISGTTNMKISWNQMSGKETVDGTNKLESLLGFSKLTTSENGHSVKGKYSFPGNRTELDGEDYPFPTILTQVSGLGKVVNVHYGEWPLEGIYWSSSRADMDIFDDMVLEGEEEGIALKEFTLEDKRGILGTKKSMSDFRFLYSSGQDADTQDDTTQLLEEEERIAEVKDIRYDGEKQCYVASVKALKTGTTVITATVTGTDRKEYTASFTLTVTADLNVYASSSTVTQYVGDSTTLTVYAVPMSQYDTGEEEIATAEIQADTSDVDTVSEEDTQTLEEQSMNTEENSPAAVQSEDLSQDMTEEASDTDAEENSVIEMTIDDTDTAEEAVISPYADTVAVAPEKNLADRMKWDIEESEDGPLTVSKIGSDGTFTIQSEAVSEVTLTITGTYTYEGIDYTGITWVDVTTLEVSTPSAESVYDPSDDAMVQEETDVLDDMVIDGGTEETDADNTGTDQADDTSAGEDDEIMDTEEMADQSTEDTSVSVGLESLNE